MPIPLNDRFVPARHPVQVTFLRPGPTPKSAALSITGTHLGDMYARGEMHHHRIRTPDGITHLVPPNWLTEPSRQEIMRKEIDGPDGQFRLVIRIAASLGITRTQLAAYLRQTEALT